MNAKVCYDYSARNFTDSNLVIIASNYVENIKEEPKLITPLTKELNSTIDAFSELQTGIVNAIDGSKADKLTKRNLRKKLELELKNLTWKAVMIADEDTAMLLRCGFTMHKEYSNDIEPLLEPDISYARPGVIPETILVKWQPVKGARLYDLKYTPLPVTEQSEWKLITQSRSRLLIEGLTSGTKYAIEVAAAGKRPLRVWSQRVISYAY